MGHRREAPAPGNPAGKQGGRRTHPQSTVARKVPLKAEGRGRVGGPAARHVPAVPAEGRRGGGGQDHEPEEAVPEPPVWREGRVHDPGRLVTLRANAEHAGTPSSPAAAADARNGCSASPSSPAAAGWPALRPSTPSPDADGGSRVRPGASEASTDDGHERSRQEWSK